MGGEEREKRRDEPPAEEGAPPTHTSSAPHPFLSLSSPAHLNKLTPLDVCVHAHAKKHKCASTCTLEQTLTNTFARTPDCSEPEQPEIYVLRFAAM